MALDLDGLIPATVLPMAADGAIDEPALRSYIAWVVEQGPVALAINVDTGEGPHLTHDEKVQDPPGRPRRHRPPDRGRVGRPVHGCGGPPGTRLQGRRRRRPARLPDPGLPEPAPRSARPRRVPHGDRRGRAAAHPVPAPARAGRRQLRGRRPRGDGAGRRSRRDQGGVVRRAPLRRHGSPSRAAPEDRSRSSPATTTSSSSRSCSAPPAR